MSTQGRHVLLGVAGRRLSDLRGRALDAPLNEVAHDQLARLGLRPGDRVYLGAYSEGRLAVLGRVNVATVAPPFLHALAPYSECRFDRIADEGVARALRSPNGVGLRFLRALQYELHPAALLNPIEMDAASAALLDDMLQEGNAEPATASDVSAPSTLINHVRRFPPRPSPASRFGGTRHHVVALVALVLVGAAGAARRRFAAHR